ncbi:MAG: hypothetical protein LIO62_04450 [Clostridiales bacterium]|nr:hypothetical protein [Clostridiales bacterium]
MLLFKEFKYTRISDNSKTNLLNKEVLSADKWDENAILNRAKALSEILLHEFEYIDLHSDAKENTESFFYVDSVYDFSNSKPYEMVFLGEHTKVSKWKDLLTKTINTAYDLDPQTILQLALKNYSITNATKIYISNDMRKLRNARQIDNTGIYYETNLSANNIVAFIKDLLLKMQLDTDDLMFSLSETKSEN